MPDSHPLRVRELKRRARQRLMSSNFAPFTGAWIETLKPNQNLYSSCLRTLYGCVNWNLIHRWYKLVKLYSHPLRVRELKHGTVVKNKVDGTFAPFTGAWIETPPSCRRRRTRKFAPFTGAWIETWRGFKPPARTSSSHPLRVRELKRHHW